ncbi:MAG: type II 3-dehydroquinate dehydratase [Maricaulaceae bacterium]
MQAGRTKSIFVLNGPNLNRLGDREPEVYGATRLVDIERLCQAQAERCGFVADFRQTNHEGVLVDWLHEADGAAAAVVLNPAAFTHTSVAVLDAVKAIGPPVVETHLSMPAAREPFRHTSYVSLAADGVISGFGALSYELAVTAAARLAQERTA